MTVFNVRRDRYYFWCSLILQNNKMSFGVIDPDPNPFGHFASLRLLATGTSLFRRRARSAASIRRAGALPVAASDWLMIPRDPLRRWIRAMTACVPF